MNRLGKREATCKGSGKGTVSKLGGNQESVVSWKPCEVSGQESNQLVICCRWPSKLRNEFSISFSNMGIIADPKGKKTFQ